MGQNRPKFRILLKSHQVVTNMSYGCVSFFTKFQSTLLVPVQMASPQRRPTAETGYSSGRYLKLDNKNKTRIIFFHFSCTVFLLQDVLCLSNGNPWQPWVHSSRTDPGGSPLSSGSLSHPSNMIEMFFVYKQLFC